MTGPIFQRRATAKVGQWRSFPVRPAAAGLAATLATGLVIPALAVVGGAGVAAASAGAPAAIISPARTGAGRLAGAAGGTAAAGTAASGHVLAWGRNDFGQLGNGTSTDARSPVRVRLPGSTKVQQVRAGCDHTVALTSTGHVLAWGINGYGQLGNGSIASRETPVQVRIPRGTKVTAVRAGCDFSLALTSRGGVLAWGDNIYGQLGNGTTTDSHVPVRVQLPAGTKVTAISAGGSFALARTAGGRVLAWGENTNAELGNDSTTSSDVPLRVDLPPGVRVTIVSAGYNFAVAGAAGRPFAYFAWGANNLGQYGNGSTAGSATPVSVIHTVRGPGHVHLASLFAGCGHTLALFSSGVMLAWGANAEGQLGNGTTTSSDAPVVVKLGRTKVGAISASCDDSYALTRNGRVLAWGYDSEGQLGNGGATSSDTPLRVHLPTGWSASAVGSGPVAGHALAIVHRKA
jgi:alpha-tubulin suppressor-like RCC1 family protein